MLAAAQPFLRFRRDPFVLGLSFGIDDDRGALAAVFGNLDDRGNREIALVNLTSEEALEKSLTTGYSLRTFRES